MSRSMLLAPWWRLVTFVTLMMSLRDVLTAKCPWVDEGEDGMYSWSDPNAWDDQTVPGLHAEVSVTKRVLLDVQPPNLSTITVQPGGALVWGNVQDITLNVTYILVLGAFHIGSQDCRFRKRATINLYGLTNSVYDVTGFGRKFIGVDQGGQLEMHGLDKVPWTKLAHTIPAAEDLNCSVLFDFSTSLLGQETKSGLYVLLWNSDGSVRDFNVFTSSTYYDLAPFLQNLPDGTLVAAAVKTTLGTPTGDLYTALETLGAKSIRSVSSTYAFIARTEPGQKSSAREEVASENCASITDTDRDLSFRVTSSAASGKVYFKVIDGEVASPKITVQDDVSSWAVGDQVAVLSTDFDWRQAEVKTIVACSDCLENQIKLDSPFKYMHYGEVTLNVDERAEVALLTRDVKVQGQLEDECYYHNDNEQWLCDKFQQDTFGGHIKARYGSTIPVEGVELFHMGQQQFTASYPLHFHMMNDASGMWFRNNSIHHSMSRCITVHGSHNSEVSDNVCYLHFGHGYFMEDSVEQNTTMHRNLGAGTMHGALILSDRDADWCEEELKTYCNEIATFWLTHPNNAITNNIAGGSDGTGFFYVFADAPIGVSKNAPFITDVVANNSLQYFPIKKFAENVAHSNAKNGLFFDSKISTGELDVSRNVFVPENGIIPTTNSYDPRDPPDESGVPVWTTMDRNTFYKNKIQNVWLKTGNVRMQNSSLADSQKGFFGGTIGFNSGVMVKDSVFVATTDNKGLPFTFVDKDLVGKPSKEFDHSISKSPYDTIAGMGIYQGPVYVENCHFSRYKNVWWADEWEATYGFRPVSPGGALSFQRSNLYPTKPHGYVKSIKFDSCDNVDDANWVFKGNLSTFGWDDEDGNLAHTFRDADGSVTGQANTQVVIDRPFYAGDECVPRPNWHMTVCPYKYVQVEIVGSNGVLSKTKKDQSPLIFRRDDAPEDPLQLKGTQRNTYLLQTQRSYSVNFNPTLGTVPTFFDVRVANLEKGDVIRLGLCLPNDTTTFEVKSDYPAYIRTSDPHIMASSLQELDEDVSGRKFFWDATVGMLYFKLISNETRQNLTEECANGLCPRYKIKRLDGGDGPTDCSGHNNPPIAVSSAKPSPPQPKICTGPDSAEGLGAVPSDVLVASPFTIDTCPATDPVTDRSPTEFRGCFKDKTSAPDLPFFRVDLFKAMTPQWCQDRCFYRGYLFSGVGQGKRCWCGDSFGLHGVLDTTRCDKPCTGDKEQTCGSSGKNEVYTTGLALKPLPSRCGPNNLGEVFEDKCLYAQLKLMSVGKSQRLCARLGGNLVAIDSLEKQTAVEQYLRDKITKYKVWIGLNHVRDVNVWEQRDGKPLGDFTFWKGTAGSDPDKHFVYMVGTVGYQWIQTKDTTTATAVPLCDLPMLQPASARKKRAAGPDNSSQDGEKAKQQKYVATYENGYVVMKLVTDPNADVTDATTTTTIATTQPSTPPTEASAITTVSGQLETPSRVNNDNLMNDVSSTTPVEDSSTTTARAASLDAEDDTASALFASPMQPLVSVVEWTAPGDVEPCGENESGRRAGPSGTCYLVLHELMSQEMASYACHIAKGTLADYTNRATEELLSNALYRYGVDQDYWIAKTNKVMKWQDSIYANAKVLKTDVAGALCVLETLDSTKRCSTGWVENSESCYLSLGTVAKSYLAGASLCERDDGSSYLVRVDSEEENTFLSSLITPGSTVTSNVLLGLCYSPRHDDFIWGNGDLTTNAMWSDPGGAQNLPGGSCAVLDSGSGSWSNVQCHSMIANLVCETPAFV